MSAGSVVPFGHAPGETRGLSLPPVTALQTGYLLRVSRSAFS